MAKLVVPSRVRNSSIRAISIRVLGVCLLLFVLGCEQQGQGFNLPKGNVEQGRMTFILLHCNSCHSVITSQNSETKGIDWDPFVYDAVDEALEVVESEQRVHVVLGGKVTQIKTYGDLVTSVINPNHKLSRGLDQQTITADGDSKMKDYNEVMSVQELIDLVSYLESKYEIWVPDYYQY